MLFPIRGQNAPSDERGDEYTERISVYAIVRLWAWVSSLYRSGLQDSRGVATSLLTSGVQRPMTAGWAECRFIRGCSPIASVTCTMM